MEQAPISKTFVVCVISARDGVWEGLCLDFDIAVHGDSLDDVRQQLETAIQTYALDAMAEAEPHRSRLLNRRVPWWTELGWALKFLFHSVRRAQRPDFEGRIAVSCRA